MLIVTRSGQQYYYDKKTNRISFDTIGNVASDDVALKSENVSVTPEIIHFCIEMTRQCNFRCKYCCYSGEYKGWRSHRQECQSQDNLDKIIAFIARTVSEDNDISVSFYGGEALLEFPKIQYLVESLREKFGKKVSFSLSTNGYLLTPRVVDYICTIPQFEVNVTIDGDEVMHNANRVLVDGQGTYKRIMDNLSDFQNRYPEEFDKRIGFLATLYTTLELLHLNEAWMENELLKEHLPKHVSTITPNFAKELKSTTFEQKCEVFYQALDQYKQGINNVLTSQLQEVASTAKNRKIFDWTDGEQLVSTCLSQIDHCFIDCDGNIAPCERVCDSFRIGNLDSGFDYDKVAEYNNQFISFQNTHCKSCWAQRLCQVCPKHMEYEGADMEYICNKERELAQLSLLMFCEMVEADSCHC